MTTDPLFDEFGQDEDVFGDVFGEAFGMDVFGDDDFTRAASGAGDIGGQQPIRDTSKLPIAPPLPPRPKKKEKVKPMEENDNETIQSKWRKVMDQLKQRRALTINERDSVPFIQDFMQGMAAAVEADEEDFKAGRPMLHKLGMLDKALMVMQKYAFAELFVSMDGCRVLASWLKPLPNGELPNAHMRTALLRIMARLPITKESLIACKDEPLGAIIAKLSQHPKETVENRMLASQLVERWLKQVLTKRDTNVEVFEEEERPIPMLPRKPVETAESFEKMQTESFSRMHARIPMVGGQAYQIQPLSVHQPLKQQKLTPGTNRGKVNEVMRGLAKPNKKCWKPHSVSVGGQGVNV